MPLDNKTARKIVEDKALPLLKERFGVPFDATPIAVTRLEIGWMFELSPTKSITRDGRRIYNVRYIVDDRNHRLHIVGTPGVDRAIERIKADWVKMKNG